MSTTTSTTPDLTPSRGHRLRRAAARTALVVGFATGGWLVATATASAAPVPAHTSLLGGGDGGSLLGPILAPVAPVLNSVAPVLNSVAPVASVLNSVAPVLAPVIDPIAPVAPVAPVPAPVAPVVNPVIPAPAVPAPVAADPVPVTAPALTPVPVHAVPTPVPTVGTHPPAPVDGPVTRGPTGYDTATTLTAPTTNAAPTPNAAPALVVVMGPGQGPILGPPVPTVTTPMMPMGTSTTPSPGTATSSNTGVGHVFGVVYEPATVHPSTLTSVISTTTNATLLNLADDPGFSPD